MSNEKRPRRRPVAVLVAVCLATALFVAPGCGGDKTSDSGKATSAGGDASRDGKKAETPDEPSDADLIAPSSARDKTADAAGGASDGNNAPRKVVGERPFEERYPDNSLRRRWNAKVFSNFIPGKAPEGSWVYDGPYVEFYRGGTKKLSEGSYADDQPDGDWRYWHPNGQLAKEGRYAGGKLDGKWTYRREDGTLEREEEYAGGKKNGVSIRYSEDGESVEERIEYQDGQRHGTWTTWHTPTQKAFEAHYANGLLEGLRKTWYPNGQLQSEEHFKAGKPDGMFRRWDEKGTEIERVEYENGRRKT